jgi:hypothetical protein
MTDSLTFLREHAKQHRIEADATNSMDERTKHLVFAKHFTAAADELERLRSRVADHEQVVKQATQEAKRYQRVRSGELPFEVIEHFAHSGCVELHGEALDTRVDQVIAAEQEQSPHD